MFDRFDLCSGRYNKLFDIYKFMILVFGLSECLIDWISLIVDRITSLVYTDSWFEFEYDISIFVSLFEI